MWIFLFKFISNLASYFSAVLLIISEMKDACLHIPAVVLTSVVSSGGARC